MTSSTDAGGSCNRCNCSRTTTFQSGMAYPRKLIESLKKASPFPSQRHKLLFPDRSQGIITTVAASLVFLPPPDNPLTLFELVEHGIKRRQSKVQGAVGLFLDTFGDLEAIVGFFRRQRRD